MRPASLVALALVSLCLLSPLGVQANGGEVGVLNVPPSIGQLTIGDGDGTNKIVISVADMNGRDDIKTVKVDFLDSAENRRASFSFTQYDENRTERINRFENEKGDWLLNSSSTVERYHNGDIYLSRCVLNITFTFNPGIGSWIRIVVTDSRGANATAKVPYSVEGVEIPVPLRNPQATLSISAMTALAVTLIVLRGRYSSDKLAQSIERRMARKEQEESIDDLMERMG